MERKKASWEESIERYKKLLEEVKDLIHHNTLLAEYYQITNKEFAYLIYEHNLYEIMAEANKLKDYDRNFQFMYFSLKGQVEQLNHLQQELTDLLIKDPSNCPDN
ncbi:hypothetical protein JMN32_04405 [Fulvivirga sp. 29W222]|uniref:Uncharacterized protein n=1 Tax=Fulvivirga marina TaxID=2494733 RepID=A0A937FWC0_9BACT|nr:hypothetical protein [Fulvivirga marina]MBL6445536.1 hypothetical protein [Fulvivirga marina]